MNCFRIIITINFPIDSQYLFYNFVLKHYENLKIVGCFLLDPLLKKLRSVLVSACEFANSLSELLQNMIFVIDKQGSI